MASALLSLRKICYARTSSVEQNLNLQLDVLQAAGCERIYREHTSGKRAERSYRRRRTWVT